MKAMSIKQPWVQAILREGNGMLGLWTIPPNVLPDTAFATCSHPPAIEVIVNPRDYTIVKSGIGVTPIQESKWIPSLRGHSDQYHRRRTRHRQCGHLGVLPRRPIGRCCLGKGGNIVEPLTGRWRSLLAMHIPASQRERP
jgi:hypothetical protein